MAVGLNMKLSKLNMGSADYINIWLLGLDMKLSKQNMGLNDYITKWPWT